MMQVIQFEADNVVGMRIQGKGGPLTRFGG